MSRLVSPHGEQDRLNVSGTALREMFANHEPAPGEFSRPEGLDVQYDTQGCGWRYGRRRGARCGTLREETIP